MRQQANEPEFKALNNIVRIMNTLTDESRVRIIRYLKDRWGDATRAALEVK